jgi:prephenate dehydratase
LQYAEEKRLLSQYSADSLTTTVRAMNPTSKSKNKKARFEVLAQYTYSKEEEEGAKKPAAKKPRNKTEVVAEEGEAKYKTEVAEDNIEDPKEQDPKFRIVRRHRHANPQLTLTQYCTGRMKISRSYS